MNTYTILDSSNIKDVPTEELSTIYYEIRALFTLSEFAYSSVLTSDAVYPDETLDEINLGLILVHTYYKSIADELLRRITEQGQ